MVKIVLTDEIRKKESHEHPFSLFGREIPLAIPVWQFPGSKEIHASLETMKLKQPKLYLHQTKRGSCGFSFDYNLELSQEDYEAYQELRVKAKPVLFSFHLANQEVASLEPMGEVGLHAKKQYLISFVDEEKKLQTLMSKQPFSVHVAALSITEM
ncbi:MAG: hypothetical protein FJZ56_03955 [Chlamydiae bacterium]|nr:hypothetical protein [Chlamydiota bacterium]